MINILYNKHLPLNSPKTSKVGVAARGLGFGVRTNTYHTQILIRMWFLNIHVATRKCVIMRGLLVSGRIYTIVNPIGGNPRE